MEDTPNVNTDASLQNTNQVPEKTNKSYNSFLFFFSGQVISLFGSSISQIIIVLWLTFESGFSGTVLGIASVLGFGTTLLVIPVAGVFVDRWSRRKIIATVDSLEAVATLILITLFLFQIVQIWHIYILLTIRGILQGFHDPAVQAIIPVLVPKSKLNVVNSLSYLTNGIIFLIGPIIGVTLFSVFGSQNIGFLLLIDAITFIIATIPLVFVKIPSVKKAQSDDSKLSFKQEFIEGISYIKKTKGLISLLAAFVFVNFFSSPLFALLPIIISSPMYLHEPAESLSYALAAGSIGTIVGSLIMSKFKLFQNNAKGVAAGLLGFYITIAVAIIAIVSDSLILLCLALLFGGFMLPLANISSQTIWQTVVPLQLQGRVYSARRMIAQLSSPLGILCAGILADFINIQYIFIFSASAGFIILTYMWFFTKLPVVEKILKTKDKAI